MVRPWFCGSYCVACNQNAVRCICMLRSMLLYPYSRARGRLKDELRLNSSCVRFSSWRRTAMKRHVNGRSSEVRLVLSRRRVVRHPCASACHRTPGGPETSDETERDESVPWPTDKPRHPRIPRPSLPSARPRAAVARRPCAVRCHAHPQPHGSHPQPHGSLTRPRTDSGFGGSGGGDHAI